ncbi:MAG: WD40 repeat domain-containing protein [Parachlamydiales bacterium]
MDNLVDWFEEPNKISFKFAELNEEVIGAQFGALPDATSVTFSESEGLTDPLLFKVGQAYGQRIQKLNLAHCGKITLDGVTTLLKLCPNLKSLNLNHGPFTATAVLKLKLFEAAPLLQVLKLPSGIKIERPVSASCKEVKSEGPVEDLISGKLEKITFGSSVAANKVFSQAERYTVDDLVIQHDRGVWRMGTTHDNRLLTASYDKKIGIWTFVANEAKPTVKFFTKNKQAALCVVELDPMSGLIGFGEHAGRWRGWNPQTDKFVESAGHREGVYSLVKIGSDLVATGSCDMVKKATNWKFEIKVWSFPACKPVITLTGHQGAISGLVVLYTGTGPLLVSSSADKTVKVWQAGNWHCVHTFTTHKQYVYGLAKIDNRRVATGSKDHEVHILDVIDRKLLFQLKGHTNTVYDVAFIGNNLIASASRDQTVRIWDVQGGTSLVTLPEPGQIVYSLTSLPGELFVGLEKGKILRYRFENRAIGDKHYLLLQGSYQEKVQQIVDFDQLKFVDCIGMGKGEGEALVDLLIKHHHKHLQAVMLQECEEITGDALKKLCVSCPHLTVLSVKNSNVTGQEAEEMELLASLFVHNPALQNVVSSQGLKFRRSTTQGVDNISLTSSTGSMGSAEDRGWRYY